ncbi:MAG: hypothetical protein KAT05_12350 [Spirochaetes bacterium]|nr:hypothetical protein [Spirochaetota bacterium]
MLKMKKNINDKVKVSFLIIISIFAILSVIGCATPIVDDNEEKEEGVPSSWNGDYQFIGQPGVRVMAVHDGNIYAIDNIGEVNIFPANYQAMGFTITYSENECKAELNSDNYTSFSKSGNVITFRVVINGTEEYFSQFEKM